MSKAQRKRSAGQGDLNQLAARIVTEATGQAPKTSDPDAGKDPAAVASGRLGGKKGGAARAAKLTKKRRKQIAKKAARARWRGKRGPLRPATH